MISVATSILLIGFGGLFMLVGVIAGVVLHLRYIDKKLLPPAAKPQPTQKLSAIGKDVNV